MKFVKFSALAISVAFTRSVSAGANFAACVDWMPDQNPDMSPPFQVFAQFSPTGSYMHCIDGGRGTLEVNVPPNAGAGRYCSNQFVYAAMKSVTGFDCDSPPQGVFPVFFTGPAPWPSRYPGVNIAVAWGVDTATIFGDHGNIVICDNLQSGCDYQTSVTWDDASTGTAALVYQPNGALSQEIAKTAHAADDQYLFIDEM
ncbi:MAG: hypothetical protein HETSPECPRED_001809 [Heterodermia speciosa]|uniref:Uncharacterized protein n=1 Tax=Heterodermia speciosa TaxID=116794 RepID=A0A8H3J2I7_9LECA|nr:MAG: hypothetical protein HETSPECPRED_001809 [Heterodermia speciosa]